MNLINKIVNNAILDIALFVGETVLHIKTMVHFKEMYLIRDLSDEVTFIRQIPQSIYTTYRWIEEVREFRVT